MSSIRKVGDRKYEARWRTPEGGDRRKRFPTKGEATAHLAIVDAELVRGTYVDAAAGKVTFGDYAREWQSVQVHHRPGTTSSLNSHLHRHILPTFGDRPIGAIRTTEVRAWVKMLTQVPLAASTVEGIYRHLASIFLAAVADQVIAASPCVDVKLPKIDRAPVQPLSTETVHALIAAMPDRYRALVVLGAGTGLRSGEAFGVTVDRIDFLRRRLRVDRQVVLLPGTGPSFGPPKTDASYRTVPLPDVVLDALSSHIATYGEGPDRLVFTNDDGAMIRRTRFTEVWQPAASSVGIPSGTGFHALRHYYASLLIRHGESVKVVQSRLGHATAQETLDTYAHLWPDSEDTTRSAIDSVLGGSVAIRGNAVAIGDASDA